MEDLVCPWSDCRTSGDLSLTSTVITDQTGGDFANGDQKAIVQCGSCGRQMQFDFRFTAIASDS